MKNFGNKHVSDTDFVRKFFEVSLVKKHKEIPTPRRMAMLEYCTQRELSQYISLERVGMTTTLIPKVSSNSLGS